MNKIYNVLREDIEAEKTKYIVLACVFIGQSLITVLSQYFLPEILAASDIPPEFLPEPSALTAVSNFFDNFIIVGTVLFILTSMAIFASDKETGVIYYSLARPIKRYEYALGKILTKFIVVSAIVIFTVFSVVFYSEFIFSQRINTIDYFSIITAFLLLNFFLISLTGLFSSRMSSINAGLMSLSIGLTLFAGSAILADLSFLSPFYLAGKYNLMIMGQFSVFNELGAIISIITWISGTVILTIISLQKQDF